MTMKTVMMIALLQLLVIVIIPITATTADHHDYGNYTHSLTPNDQDVTDTAETIVEDVQMSEDKVVVSPAQYTTQGKSINNTLSEITEELRAIAVIFGVEITTDHDATSHPVDDTSLFPIANSYKGSYYLLSRARRLVEGDPTIDSAFSGQRPKLTKISISETAVYARHRRIGQWIGGNNLYTELEFFAHQDRRHDEWTTEMAKKEKIFRDTQRYGDEIGVMEDTSSNASSQVAVGQLLPLTLSMSETTKRAKLRRKFILSDKNTIESKVLRLATDVRDFQERIYDTFVNRRVPTTSEKRTKGPRQPHNNDSNGGKTRQYVKELRDTLLKYYTEDPSVTARYMNKSMYLALGGTNEDYGDLQTEVPIFGMLSLTPKYENTLNDTIKHFTTPIASYSLIFNRATSWFQTPSSWYLSIQSVPFFDFAEMNLLWHEYHSLKNDEIWLRKTCFRSMSRCRTEDVNLRANTTLQGKGKNDLTKANQQDKITKDDADSHEDGDGLVSTGDTAAAEIVAQEADLVASSESYYSNLQNNILITHVTYPLDQLFNTFSLSQSYQRKLMYSGLPLLFYQVQPYLEGEAELLRSQMNVNDESTMEKRRELKQQNQRMKVITQQQKDVQLLIEHIRQCIQYKKQSSMNMKYIPSLLRWIGITRRYGGSDLFPTSDVQFSLTGAQKRRRGAKGDGEDLGLSLEEDTNGDNDNTDTQYTTALNSYSINLFSHRSIPDALHGLIFTIFGLRIYEVMVIILIMVLPTSIDMAINTPYWTVRLYRFTSRHWLQWLVKKIQQKKNPNHRIVSARTVANPRNTRAASAADTVDGDQHHEGWIRTFMLYVVRFIFEIVGVIVTLCAQYGYLFVPLVPLIFFLGGFERNFVEPLYDFVTNIKGREWMLGNFISSEKMRRNPIRRSYADGSNIEIWFTVWVVVTKVQRMMIFVVLMFIWGFLANFILKPMYRLSLKVEVVNARGGR